MRFKPTDHGARANEPTRSTTCRAPRLKVTWIARSLPQQDGIQFTLHILIDGRMIIRVKVNLELLTSHSYFLVPYGWNLMATPSLITLHMSDMASVSRITGMPPFVCNPT